MKIKSKKSGEDFNFWNEQKQAVHFDKQRPFFHEQEVWFCALGANIGFEQDGRGEGFLRPVLILRKFNNEICWALPMTKNIKQGAYYMAVSFRENEQSALILSQIRLVDAKRLVYKAGSIKQCDFERIKEKIRQLLA
jgi:mRNA-degrading endonuclease toxin of MazEF toxin-antitoxin module